MSIHNTGQRLESLRKKHKDNEIFEGLDQYLQQKLDNPNEDHHYRHMHNLSQILQHHQGLEDIDQDTFQDVMASIEKSSYATRTDKFSKSTKNKYRKTLDYLLKTQSKNWEDYALPGVNIYQKTNDQDTTDKDQLLNPENLNTFLQKAGELSADKQSLRNEAFFYTLWNTAARTGGVLQIRLEDVTVSSEVVEVTVPSHKDSPKRENLPLYFAAPVLKRYINSLPKDQEYLFESREGQRLGYAHLRKKALQTYEETGLDVKFEGQPLHLFRKSFKTYASIMELMPPGELDIWTGHALGATQIKRLYDRRDTETAGRSMRKSLGLETEDRKDWKKVLAPQKCESCGEKNSSHRPSCYSCGGVLKPENLPDQVKVNRGDPEKAELIGKIKSMRKLIKKMDLEEDVIK